MRISSILLVIVMAVGCSDPYQPNPAQTNTVAEGGVSASDGTEPEGDPAPAETTGDQADDQEAGPTDPLVDVGTIQLTAPEGWIRKTPRSTFVQAEFELPKADGDENDGRLTISVAGGSIDANVDRWRGQFGGKPEKDVQDTLDVADLSVTVVDLAGTFNDQPGPFAPGVQREGYRMMAAIVPGDGQQLHFIKAYGPQKTMAAHEDAFREFLHSIKAK